MNVKKWFLCLASKSRHFQLALLIIQFWCLFFIPIALPPCWEAMKESTRFVNPSCDEDGYFTPLQCHEYMGCYCVDKYGNPRTHLSQNGRSFIRNCKNFAHPVTEDRKWIILGLNDGHRDNGITNETRMIYPNWTMIFQYSNESM